MSISLTLTMLLLALVASPHCASMCGCGLAQHWLAADLPQQRRFLAGRVMSGVVLGALAGGASQVSAYWMQQGVQLFAVAHWVLLAMAGFMGVVLIFQARSLQLNTPVPVRWLGRNPLVANGTKGLGAKPRSVELRPLLAGFSWMALPCGVIYSAVALAYVSGSALQGAWLMGVFCLGSTLSLIASSRLLFLLRKKWSEATVARIQGVLILSGLFFLLMQKLQWVQTPRALAALGFCL